MHVAPHGEPLDRLAAHAGFRTRGLTPSAGSLRARGLLLRVLGHGMLAGDAEVPAGELYVALQHDAALLRFDPHVPGFEIERTGGKHGGGRQKSHREGEAEHRGPPIWS